MKATYRTAIIKMLKDVPKDVKIQDCFGVRYTVDYLKTVYLYETEYPEFDRTVFHQLLRIVNNNEFTRSN